MNLNKSVSCLFCLIIFFAGIKVSAQTNRQQLAVSNIASANSFPLVASNKAATIYVSSSEASVVHIAAAAFQKDVQLVTGIQPSIKNNSSPLSSLPVIVGTIGQSELIGQLIRDKKLFADSIKGKWETFIIALVDHPFKNIEKALCIVGSDSRGAAFGVFELSKMIGVSPWVWWADVIPEHKDALYITAGNNIVQSPSVQYRGIFLNDEDWGLQPWAAKKMDADINDIGPNTYAHIFELLLRLKANYIWPAMHPCTKAFYFYKDNAVMADKYGIVVGTSHCEPMLRNNVFEWSENYKNEYKTDPKEWRYDVNKVQIYPYWNDRIQQVKNYESVITVGMRGVHDGSMPGPKDVNAKVKLLENIIADQRTILQENYQKPATDIPQIFCPYKEVLQLYRAGLKLPGDVTIVWADDNFGYITQLSNTREQQRSGGSGVYYHLSYWGAPQDYLWLSTNSPSLISYEMSKAYQFNAKRLWVFNVGDLKPAEMEINFAMDLAWNTEKWNPENAYNYTASWINETFGPAFVKQITHIKNEYYRLAQSGKPEHMAAVSFNEDDAVKRLTDYRSIAREAKEINQQIPARLKDAFYELILYPVQGACLMNEKILYARKSMALAKQGKEEALQFANKAEQAYHQIEAITTVYNKEIAKAKWDGIMSCHPRGLDVFKMPPVANAALVAHYKADTAGNKKQADNLVPVSISAVDYAVKKDAADRKIIAIEGLGIDGKSISTYPYNVLPVPAEKLSGAPYIEYKVRLTKGIDTVVVKCLPTNSINRENPLLYAISVNNDEVQWVDISSEKNNWGKNVVNGYSRASTIHQVSIDGESIIRIYLPNSGLVISKIEIIAEKQKPVPPGL